MKNIIIFLLVFGIFFCSCQGMAGNESDERNVNFKHALGTHEGLSEETELQILHSYFDTHIKPYNQNHHPREKLRDYYISGYFGNYNGTIAVLIDSDTVEYACMITEITVAGDIKFIYSVYHIIIAWKDNVFYDLQEAYELKLLTYEDILSIRDYHMKKPVNILE